MKTTLTIMTLALTVLVFGAAAPAATLMLDFATNNDYGVYDAIPSGLNGILVENLIDTEGNATDIDLVYDGFGAGSNNDVEENPTGDAAIFNPNAGNSLYGTGDAVCTVALSSLTAGSTYDFTIYASRPSATDTRIADYVLEGATTSPILSLDAGGNTSEVVSFVGMEADAEGKITLTMTRNAASESTYFYLTAMQVVETAAVPEPATMSLVAAGGLALLRRRRR